MMMMMVMMMVSLKSKNNEEELMNQMIEIECEHDDDGQLEGHV